MGVLQMPASAAEAFNDEVIELLAVMLPNGERIFSLPARGINEPRNLDMQALRGALDGIPLEIGRLGPDSGKVLTICTKYHMQRR